MTRFVLVTVLVLGVAGSALAGVEEDNKALCEKFYAQVVNGGNFDLIDELMAEDFVEHEPFPGLEPNREGVRKFFKMMRTAFPDLKFDVEFMMADGDKVMIYATMGGTHKGEFMGMPASGKTMSIHVADIVRIQDGKAVEHWGVTDGLTMMHQLGAIPGEGSAK